jgi:AAA family ATP:ADP antiporter
MATGLAPARPARGPLERVLAPFADVRGGEAVSALLLMLNVFLLLTAYYVIKTVREPLILAGGGAEVKSYAAAGQTVLLLILIPLYGAFASRVNRGRLITWVTLFFISNLVVFYLLAQAGVRGLGVPFFLWAGIFNLMVIAQFWSFANDVYSPEQGKRLFAIVAAGQTLGAILGAGLAERLIEPLGVYALMLVAAGLLVGSIVLTLAVNAREKRTLAARPGLAAQADQPLGREGGFKLVLSHRYLLLIGLLMVAVNFVNTNGEYILGKTVAATADQLVAAGAAGAESPDFKETYIGRFYGNFFFWVNVVTAIVQLFVVSRVIKWFGVRAALFVLPVIAFAGYGILATVPALAAVRLIKIFENATDYSLQNTARQALFLPTSREAKYKAKQAIDTLFWRAGDLLSTALVFVGSLLAFQTRHFAMANLVLVAAWLVVVLVLSREHRRASSEAEAGRPIG